MIGTIFVEGLKILCIVGIHPEERIIEQALIVDCEFDRDFEACAAQDDFAKTVDYTLVAERLTHLAQEKRYQLIETYAEESAALVLAEFNARRVAIKVMKPAAIPQANWAAVQVERFSSQ